MKRNVFGIALIGIALVMGSCFLGEFTTDDYFLKVSVDGTAKEWNGVGVAAVKVDSLDGIAITATKTENLSGIEVITMTIDGFDGEGEYNIDLITATGVSYIYKTTDNDVNALSSEGKITITKYKDEVVEGTFSCKMVTTDSKTVELTAGSFATKLKMP